MHLSMAVLDMFSCLPPGTGRKTHDWVFLVVFPRPDGGSKDRDYCSVKSLESTEDYRNNIELKKWMELAMFCLFCLDNSSGCY